MNIFCMEKNNYSLRISMKIFMQDEDGNPIIEMN